MTSPPPMREPGHDICKNWGQKIRPQRRSAGSGGNSDIGASPGRLYDGRSAQTRRKRATFETRNRGPRFAEKRVVVQAVRSEPVSAEFPVKQGINREFLRNHPVIRPFLISNTLVSLVYFAKFPKHRNREFFQRNREFNPWNRELSGWIREPPDGPPRDQIGCPQGCAGRRQ